MKKQLVVLLTAVFLIGLMSLSTAGTKMKVTTPSERALEHYYTGLDLSEKLRGQDAIAHYKMALSEDPKMAMAYVNLAFVSTSAKSFFKNVDKAIALIDNVSEGEQLQIMALQAAANGDAMEQLKNAEKLVKIYPENVRALNGLAQVHFGQQNFDKAINLYDKVIAINPEYSPPYNQLGYAHRALGNYDKAEAAFQKYIELIPDDPNPYDSYAELLLKLGRYDESIAQYQIALEKDANFVISFRGIATNYDLQGEGKAARKELKRLLDSAKNDGQRRTAHFSTAISYIYEGNMEKAIDAVKTSHALAEAINDAAAMSGDHTAIGNILLEAGKPEAALDAYKKALDLVLESDLSQKNKDNAELQFVFQKSMVAAKLGELEKAQEKADTFFKGAKETQNPFTIRQAHMAMGVVALKAKKYDAAIKHLTHANQQNPYNLYRLAKAYKGAGDADMAKSYCEKAANFHALSSLNQAFIQSKAESMLAAL
jgi:tetratricopeptide (TPR) repeat protein